jgi:chorismate mutase / prephenate dehydratase
VEGSTPASTPPGAPLVVAYFGPAGTNTHAAALAMFEERVVGPAGFQPEPTIRAVFEAVASGRAHRGVVPIENSTEGRVEQTLDCLFELTPVISGEYVAEIHHYLLGRAGTQLSAVRHVLSHPQALGQCRAWLDAHLPGVEQVSYASTGAAARDVAKMQDAVAIAPELSAELYGVTVLEREIEDMKHNATRFAAIALADSRPSGHDKTSIVFTTRHERGALRRVLETFDDEGLNLTRIESRPLTGRRWEYAFFADFEGSRFDVPVARALARIQEACGLVKLLGSYPRATEPAGGPTG